MFIAEKRRCPRCHETARWIGLTADVQVNLRVNLVPAGSYHSPSRTAMYACAACGSSFKILPKFGRILFAVSGVLGALLGAALLATPHSSSDSLALPWLVVLAILGLSVGGLVYDVVSRIRAPVVR